MHNTIAAYVQQHLLQADRLRQNPGHPKKQHPGDDAQT